MYSFAHPLCLFSSAGGKQVWETLAKCETVGSAIRRAARIFQQSCVPEPRASAEHLAVSAFGIPSRSQIRYKQHRLTSRRELDTYSNYCQERVEKRTPVQYLVGDWDFHLINLKLRPPVLIPRPETEELVELILKTTRNGAENLHFVDVGCGSGAIILALLNARPQWTGIAIDPSPHAVALCKSNAELLGLEKRCRVYLSTIEEWPKPEEEGKFDFLVSNPPYIPKADMVSLEPEVAWHEDRAALCGGEDGMDIIRHLLKRAPELVRETGSVWLELDPSHPSKISSLLKRDRLLHRLKLDKTYLDYSGKRRFSRFQVRGLTEGTSGMK